MATQGPNTIWQMSANTKHECHHHFSYLFLFDISSFFNTINHPTSRCLGALQIYDFTKTVLSPLHCSGKSVRENWLDVLNQQDTVPDAEMTKWQEFITATVELLQKIENVYKGLSFQLNNNTPGEAHSAKDEF